MKIPSDHRLPIDGRHPQDAIVRRAVAVISSGGVIAFPTRGLYGLGTDALDARSVERIFALKRRSRRSPILVLIERRSQLAPLVKTVPPSALALMERFWPGRVTLVFEASAAVPGNLTAGSGRIGIRMAGHPVARALVRTLKSPLTATSANLSGCPAAADVDHLAPELVAELDLILDAGPLAGGPGSTVIDVSVHPPRLIREGIVPARSLGDLLSR